GGDALQIALGQPGEGAGGGDLDHRRHALLPHHGHAGLPVDRGGDLGDDGLQVVGAGGDPLASGGGEQRHGGVGRLQGRGEVGQRLAGGRQVRGGGGAGGRKADRACPGRRVRGEGGQGLGGAGRDVLRGGVDVGRVPVVAIDRLELLLAVSADGGGHRGLL